MKKFYITLFILIPFISLANEFKIDQEILNTLKEVNRIRMEAGLDSVKLSVSLSKGCYNHAKYLVSNKGNEKVKGLNAHKEFKELKNFSLNGQTAGKNSVISYQKPFESVNAWISGFYHRIPLLQPNLKEIGIGYYVEKGYWPISLIDCTSGVSGRNNIDVVAYPKDGHVNVPIVMGPEIPHPMGKQGIYGFPITIYFSNWQDIKNVKVTLMNSSGKNVNCSISTPDKPATSFPQWNTICIIPLNSLSNNESYTVSVSCIVDGKEYQKTIKFKTIEK